LKCPLYCSQIRSNNRANIQELYFIFFYLCISLLFLTTLSVAQIIQPNDGIKNEQQTEGLKEVEETGIDVICSSTPNMLGRTNEKD
jgi:hypothetical protein